MPEKVSFEDFLKLTADQYAEWVNGEIVPWASITIRHQQVVGYLLMLLTSYLAERSSGEHIYLPVAMKILDGTCVRLPDLLVLSPERKHQVTETHIEGASDLVLEIISEESDDRDRVTKFREYEASGVREYWMIDPAFKEALCYFAGDDKKFRRLEVDANGDVHSQVIVGFRLHIETLWSDPLPQPAQIAEIIRQMVTS